MKKIISLVLALIMVLGMAVPAFAGPAKNIVASNAEYYDSGALKKLSTNFKWGSGYAGATCRLVLMTTELKNGDFTNIGKYGSDFDSFEEVLSHDATNGTFGIISYSNEVETRMGETYNITFTFKETDIPLDENRTYFVYLWTYFSSNYYPDNLFYVINVKDGKVKYAVPDGLVYDDEDFKEIETAPTYTVDTTTTGGGTVSVDKTTAVEGETVTVTATPNEGYELDSIDAETNGKPVEVIDGKFTMPAGNVTVAATFKEKIKTYTVTYYDEDGDVVYTETVAEGEDVKNVPAVPEKENYTGKWDHDGKNITADTEIKVEYTINAYLVNYYDENGVGIWEEEVAHGANVQDIPEVPAKDGYVGSWSHNGQNITDTTNIYPVYTAKEYNVKYIAFGRIVDEQNVKHGEDAVAPEVPLIVLWNHDGKNITEDTDIYGYSIFGNGRPAGSEEVEEDGEQNPSTGAPVFAPAVIVLSAVASFLGKRK